MTETVANDGTSSISHGRAICCLSQCCLAAKPNDEVILMESRFNAKTIDCLQNQDLKTTFLEATLKLYELEFLLL